jgi:hypothetical protein
MNFSIELKIRLCANTELRRKLSVPGSNDSDVLPYVGT